MESSGIVCIGALNHDTVVLGSPPPDMLADIQAEVSYVPYTETVITDSLAEQLSTELSKSDLSASDQLGGSAFNVLRVLLPFSSHLRLGCVGVAGAVSGRHAHIEYLDDREVETHFIERSERPAARSVAFSADGDRTLFTSSGANIEAAEAFRDAKMALGPYIASFQIAHVTSFLDSKTPEVLADIIEEALILNPKLVVSIDPGHQWSSTPSGGVQRLLTLSSILHLNAQEFGLMGSRVGNEPEHLVAARIRPLMRKRSGCRLVLRRHDSVVLYLDDESGRQFRAEIPNENLLPSTDVQDATGAGDSFTGGMLAILASPVLQFVIGARVGALVASTKVREQGPLSPDAVVEAVERVVGSLPSIVETEEQP